jgi:DNA-binding NtrC family response regulator
VIVYLPRASAGREQPRLTGSLQSPGVAAAPPVSFKVLLVDDDEDVRIIAATVLRQAGCLVLEASNAADALTIIDRGDAIDVMVTDLVMPGVPGSVLANEARLRRPDLPVLLMTGYPNTAAGKDIAEQGYLILRKPFRPAEFSAIVSKVYAQRTARS